MKCNISYSRFQLKLELIDDIQILLYVLGSRKLRNLEVNGKRQMAMWDTPYETMSNQIVIAFDLDDNFSHMAGFKLK